MNQCLYCQSYFEAAAAGQVYCSRDCRARASTLPPSPPCILAPSALLPSFVSPAETYMQFFKDIPKFGGQSHIHSLWTFFGYPPSPGWCFGMAVKFIKLSLSEPTLVEFYQNFHQKLSKIFEQWYGYTKKDKENLSSILKNPQIMTAKSQEYNDFIKKVYHFFDAVFSAQNSEYLPDRVTRKSQGLAPRSALRNLNYTGYAVEKMPSFKVPSFIFWGEAAMCTSFLNDLQKNLFPFLDERIAFLLMSGNHAIAISLRERHFYFFDVNENHLYPPLSDLSELTESIFNSASFKIDSDYGLFSIEAYTQNQVLVPLIHQALESSLSFIQNEILSRATVAHKQKILFYGCQLYIEGNSNLITLLIESGQIEINTVYEYVSIEIENGKSNAVYKYYEFTPLISAVKCGNFNIANLLISKGANLNTTNKDGYTALMIATYHNYFDIINLLLSTGVRVHINATNKNGHTALMIAAEMGHFDIVTLLINKGASLNVTDKNGYTALMIAAQNGHLMIIKFLMACPTIIFKLSLLLVIAERNRRIEVLKYLKEIERSRPLFSAIF